MPPFGLRFAVVIVLLCFVSFSKADIINVVPERDGPIFEHDYMDIEISLNDTDFFKGSKIMTIDGGVHHDDADSELVVEIRAELREDWLTRAVLVNESVILTADDPVQNVTVQGVFLGYAWLDFSYCVHNSSLFQLPLSYGNSTAGSPTYSIDCTNFLPTNQSLKIAVVRRRRIVDAIFTAIILCMVVTANLAMGCKVDIQVVKEVLRRPTAPLIGFLCQFGIMPPLAFFITRVFNLSTAEQIGLFAVGSSPGGGASNMWTLLLNGDVSLSITMTLISTLSALFMFPLWMFTLGNVIMHEVNFSIPFQNILGTLVGILVPVGIGILLQRKKPDIAKKIAKITKPMLFIFLLFLFTFGLWVNWFMFKLFHGTLIGAACLLPYLGFVISGVVAVLLRQPRARAIAITIETGIQNTGVAIFALQLSLPQPTNDLSIIGAVCPSSFTSIPLMMSLLGLTIYRKCYLKRNEKDQEKAIGEHDATRVMNGYNGVRLNDIDTHHEQDVQILNGKY